MNIDGAQPFICIRRKGPGPRAYPVLKWEFPGVKDPLIVECTWADFRRAVRAWRGE